MSNSICRTNRLDCALVFGLILAMLLTPLCRFGTECRQVEKEVLRLHILANSDTPHDQAVKLAVRDAVLAGTGEMFASVESLADAEAAVTENLALIEALAAEELVRRGEAPQVTAELRNMYFNTRYYDNATMPAGRYEALRLTIGEGEGKNWWCVVFPPLCVEVAAKEKTPLTDKLEKLDARPSYKLAFASVELVEEICEKLRSVPHSY
ncbi:MAG: stage II sporulation protein R [Angelakisella sp.]